MHREIWLRRDVRRVRSVETDCKEKRLVLEFFQVLDGRLRTFSIGLFVVRSVGGKPTEPGAESLSRTNRIDQRFLVLVAAARIDLLLPRRRVVESIRADLGRDAVVVQLADSVDGVAVLLKELRQRDP